MAETHSSAGEIAALLNDYVPKAEYELTLDALNKAIEERDKHKADAEKHTGRLTELEKKVRSRATRDAFDKIADKHKVDPKFRDDVFRLAELPADADEPDVKSIDKKLADFLSERKHYLQAETTKPKEIPPGEGLGRGGHVRPGEPELRVSRKQRNDAVWMRDNQKRFAEASKAGLLVLDDD